MTCLKMKSRRQDKIRTLHGEYEVEKANSLAIKATLAELESVVTESKASHAVLQAEIEKERTEKDGMQRVEDELRRELADAESRHTAAMRDLQDRFFVDIYE